MLKTILIVVALGAMVGISYSLSGDSIVHEVQAVQAEPEPYSWLETFDLDNAIEKAKRK